MNRYISVRYILYIIPIQIRSYVHYDILSDSLGDVIHKLSVASQLIHVLLLLLLLLLVLICSVPKTSLGAVHLSHDTRRGRGGVSQYITFYHGGGGGSVNTLYNKRRGCYH